MVGRMVDRFFLEPYTKTGENRYTKRPSDVPNDWEIFHMVGKYTNIFFQCPPNFGPKYIQIGIIPSDNLDELWIIDVSILLDLLVSNT
jgi:hypothetical protein